MRAVLIGFFLILFSVGTLCAQESTALRYVMQGDSLRRAYRFEEAIQIYQKALLISSDTLLRNKAQFNIILCDNGLNMLQYAVNLKTLGSTKIPKESFYLYLNSDSRSFWALPPPGRFPEISGDYPVFVSPANRTILFTGKQAGTNQLDLYISTQTEDMLWSYPVLMEPTINSDGNECYPVLSVDGKTLWFASDGHYGMGGFDVYVSHYDEESGSWSQAQNMGFPYSSTGNDLAFMAAPDGLTALFISDRGENGSLLLYKVGHELNPERHDWRNRHDIPLLVLLQTNDVQKADAYGMVAQDADSTTTTGGLNDYTALVQSAKKIRDEVTAQEKKLAGSRELYARLLQEEDRLTMARRIEEEEMVLIELREKFRLAGVAVQRVEMEFLQKGILPALEPAPAPKRESDVPLTPFVPQQGRLGSLDGFVFADPIIKVMPVDISFSIGKISRIIPEETLPDFLFYRIQLSVVTERANASVFKGISPVFETDLFTGKWLYAAGQFNNYAETSTALQQVQRLGFRNATIIAYYMGKSETVANARKLETTVPRATYRIALGSYPFGLPPTLLDAIRELTNRDLARVSDSSGLKYVLGPFATLKEAQQVQSALIDRGFEEIVVEIIAPLK